MVELLAQELNKDWEGTLEAVTRLIESVRPHQDWASREAIYQAIEKNTCFLMEDIEGLERDLGVLFRPGSDVESSNRHVVDLLRQWHLAPRVPGFGALSIFAIKNLGLRLPWDQEKGLIAAAILGDVENDLPYHNNLHYKKVLLQMMRLIAAHKEIYKDSKQAFNARQTGLLLIAACIHDLGHDGRSNIIGGVLEQGRLERRAFVLALPYLEACGMSSGDLDKLRVMLLCTDVAPLGDMANPVNQMKAAYRYHFDDQEKGINDLSSELSVLGEDSNLAMMALLLHEADISTSAGLDYDLTAYETAQYKRETHEEKAFPQDVADFLDDICQRTMISGAGQKLFGASMARVCAQVDLEIREGNHAYPQPEYSEFLSPRLPGATGTTGN